MANPGKSNLKTKAVELRTQGLKSLQEIAMELGLSPATCCRWLKPHPLPEDEIKRRAAVGHAKLKGVKQDPETVRRRVEKSRDKIRARAVERFGGNWLNAKNAGELTYASNKPCPKGHVIRYVKSRMCVNCQFQRGRSLSFVAQRLCAGAKWRAKQESATFDLTPRYVESIWPADGYCPVMQQPFELRKGDKLKGHLPMSPTLDRIRPEKGYVRGNVAVISAKANSIKNDCTDPKVFRRLADWLETQLNRQNS
jgi:hypothetical protein